MVDSTVLTDSTATQTSQAAAQTALVENAFVETVVPQVITEVTPKLDPTAQKLISDEVINIVKDILKHPDVKGAIESKTIWINVLALASILIQLRYGLTMPAMYQAMALPVINIILRKITKDPLVWK